MIKQLPQKKNLYHCEVFAGMHQGPDGNTKFVEDCETGVLTNSDAEPKKGIRSYRATAVDIRDVEVECTMYDSLSGKRKRLRAGRNDTWEELNASATCKL